MFHLINFDKGAFSYDVQREREGGEGVEKFEQ